MIILNARITNPSLQQMVQELEQMGFTKTEIVRNGVMELYESRKSKATLSPATV